METLQYNEKLNITELINKYDIISFDIYDTLIVRPFINPTDLFKFIELNQNITDFAKIRIAAEKKARRLYQKKNGEITFKQIYEFMPDNLKYCQNIELDYEIKYTYKHIKNSLLYEEAVKQNKIILLVSDMYLPTNTIKSILNHHGYIIYHSLFISADYGKTKLKGDLFRLVLNTLNIDQNKILHIGDNNQNDIVQANKNGISSLKVEKYIDTFLNKTDNLKFLKFLETEKYSINSSILISIFAYRDLVGFENNSYSEKIGYYIAGLTAFSYLQYINSNIQKNDILLFIARDGFLLQKIYNQFYKEHNNNYYVHGQRKLYYSMYFSKKYSLHIFPKTFNLPINKWVRRIYPYIFIKKHKKKIAAWLYNNKKEYKNYLKSLNIKGDKFVSIDMITKNYTSYKFMQQVFKHNSVKGLFFASSTKNIDNKNINIFIEKNLLFKQNFVYLIIEHLFSSDKPPVKEIKNGEIIYSNIETHKKDKLVEKINFTERGIINFYKDIYEKFSNTCFSPQLVNNFIYNYIQYPNENDLYYYKNCIIDDGNINNYCNITLYDKLNKYFKN